jgi:DNA modification methylase
MSVRVIEGDCRAVLGLLADRSVQCVVTSPPYFGLRDYGIEGIGLEASPDAYVAELVDVFREVWRVLRDDGTLWLNLGDSIKGKDLMMMPARVALALQADGWYLRSDIIWHKPNPMPESVTDRPTSSHEHLFLLAKRPIYFYDAEAIREERTQDEDANTFRGGAYVNGQTDNGVLGKRTVVGNIKLRPSMPKGSFGGKTADQAQPAFGSRNARNVWTIATAPFAEAHFATFPPELAERCIKAGTSEAGCCRMCGAPWERAIGEEEGTEGRGSGNKERKLNPLTHLGTSVPWQPHIHPGTAWMMTCKCRITKPIPCSVLDPFGGAGTVGLVADRLRRDATLIELNPAYAEMARNRVRDDAPLFTQVQ